MAQRKVGEDDVLENMAVANSQIYKRSYCQLLIGVTGNVKSGGGSLLGHLTATFYGKRELQKKWDT